MSKLQTEFNKTTLLPNIIRFRSTLAYLYPFYIALKIFFNVRIPKPICIIFS
jgi:hypothetical protein